MMLAICCKQLFQDDHSLLQCLRLRLYHQVMIHTLPFRVQQVSRGPRIRNLPILLRILTGRT